MFKHWRITIIKYNGSRASMDVLTEEANHDDDIIIELDKFDNGFLGQTLQKYSDWLKRICRYVEFRKIAEFSHKPFKQDMSLKDVEVQPKPKEEPKPWKPVTASRMRIPLKRGKRPKPPPRKAAPKTEPTKSETTKPDQGSFGF